MDFVLAMLFFFLLCSGSDVLGGYAAEERDVTGKTGILQRGAVTWRRAETFINVHIFETAENPCHLMFISQRVQGFSFL